MIDCEERLQCLARDLRECIQRIYDECVSACRCRDIPAIVGAKRPLLSSMEGLLGPVKMGVGGINDGSACAIED